MYFYALTTGVMVKLRILFLPHLEIRGLLPSDSGSDRPAHHRSKDPVAVVSDSGRYGERPHADDSERQVLQ